MTRPQLHRCIATAVPIAVATVLALALLAGCSAAGPAPRRIAPNTFELAAVQRTALAFFAETADESLPWVQLWTTAQFPTQMQNCAATESHGQLALTIGLPHIGILSYQIVGSGSEPDEAEAARIIARCAAATPLDDRVLRLPSGNGARNWDALYSYELTTLRPCLLAHGYSVSRMPERADFEARLHAQKPWSPYDTVTVSTRSAWYSLSDACPTLSSALASAVTLDP